MKRVTSCLSVVVVALATTFRCLAAGAEAQRVPMSRTQARQGYAQRTNLVVSAELKRQMARYGFTARAYTDGTNTCSCLLYVPSGSGGRKMPLVVYIPGSGEKGDPVLQFRQTALFDKVTSSAFQKDHRCCLLAISPPAEATTLIGGLPGQPNPLQHLMRDMIFSVADSIGKIDRERVYLAGFSYGGGGVSFLSLVYPGDFAAVVPVSSLTPLPEYFDKAHPGNWWLFYNEGDAVSRLRESKDLKTFRGLVEDAGGDFRIGTFPNEGHDAWTKTWAEEGLWEWMFAKTTAARPKTKFAAARKGPTVLNLARAKCSASVPGADAGEGPERTLDGLDDTGYVPARAFTKTDWWMVELESQVSGQVKVFSGDKNGGQRLANAIVEVSANGKSWSRVGSFSVKDGVCSFSRSMKFKYLRVKPVGPKPQTFLLRRLSIIAS